MRILGLFSCLALSACAVAGKDVTYNKSPVAVVLGLEAPSAVPQPFTQGATSSVRVSIPARDATAILQEDTRNGSVVRYNSSDGRAVSLRGGVIAKTQGLGPDLTGFRQSQALRAQTAQDITRVHRYLDGQNQTITLVFACNRTRSNLKTAVINRTVTPVTEIRESCLNQTLEYENSYIWIKSNGVLWRSRQWVTPQMGDIIINH